MIEYIHYNKKSYPIRVKYYALMMFKNETGQSFEKMQEAVKDAEKEGKDIKELADLGLDLNEFEIMEPLLYYSLISGLKSVDKKAKLDLVREDMFDMLEECFLEFAQLLPKFFADKKEVKKEIGAGDDGKKQLTNRQPKKKKRK